MNITHYQKTFPGHSFRKMVSFISLRQKKAALQTMQNLLDYHCLCCSGFPVFSFLHLIVWDYNVTRLVKVIRNTPNNFLFCFYDFFSVKIWLSLKIGDVWVKLFVSQTSWTTTFSRVGIWEINTALLDVVPASPLADLVSLYQKYLWEEYAFSMKIFYKAGACSKLLANYVYPSYRALLYIIHQ